MDGPTESGGYYVSEFSDFVGMMLSRSAQGVCDPNHATGKASDPPSLDTQPAVNSAFT